MRTIIGRVTEPELVHLSDVGYHEFDREMIRRTRGGIVVEQDGLLLLAGPNPTPFVVNAAMRLDQRLAASEALERINAFFSERQRPATLTTHGDRDADLLAAVAERDWEVIVELAGMVVQEPVADPSPGPGVELRRVSSQDQVSTLIDVLAEGFGPREPWPSLIGTVFELPESILEPRTAAFIAYADGVPASASVSYALQGVGCVGWVATPEAFGRRGLGELVTRAATNAAFAAGASTVVLQSSPEAAALYARIGFVEVTRYRLWTRPSNTP